MSIRKSPKIQKLVVNAIRKLQDVEGSTPREISNYISQEYDVPRSKIQRQVRLSLARAVSYGILQRSKGGYYACNRDFVGCQPQMDDGQLTEKCGRRRGRKRRRGRSRKSRRRKSGGGCRRRGGRRRGGRSRRRSRRRKSGRRGCGASGGGRRRRRGRRGGGKKSRRRRGRSRRSRRGRRCAPSGGGRGSRNDDLDVFAGRGRGRARCVSGTRHGHRSVSSGSFEEEQLDKKHGQAQPIDSPETLLD